MAFGDYVRVLRTYWRSILAVTVLGAAIGIGATFAMTPMYTATAQVYFTPDAGDGGGQDLAFGLTYTQGQMINYAALASSDAVLGPVSDLDELDLTQTPKQLATHTSADYAPSSTTLNIHFEDESAVKAADVVKAISTSLISQVRNLETKTPDTTDGTVEAPRAVVTGTLVSNPAEPSSPSSPKLQLYAAAGTMLGLILALAIALIRFFRAKAPAKEPKAAQPKAPKQPKEPKEPKEPKAEKAEKPRPQPLSPASAYKGGAIPDDASPLVTPGNATQAVPAVLQQQTTEGRIISPLQPASTPVTKRSGKRTRR